MDILRTGSVATGHATLVFEGDFLCLIDDALIDTVSTVTAFADITG
jgi:hypothetical protein